MLQEDMIKLRVGKRRSPSESYRFGHRRPSGFASKIPSEGVSMDIPMGGQVGHSKWTSRFDGLGTELHPILVT